MRSIGSGLTALDLTYSYNSNGQIASILDGSTAGLNAGGKTHTVTGLSYDGLGQLTQAHGWWGNGTYTYDGLGNIRSKSLGSGSTLRTVDYTYDSASNQVRISDDSLSPAQGGTGYRWTSHDDRGNIWAMGTHRLSYDMTDQVIGMSDTAQGYGPTDATFQYNGENKRVQMTMNGRNSFYVYDVAGRLVLSHKEHDGEGVERLFLENGQALAKRTNGAVTFFHSDHLGTIIRGTHGTGIQDNSAGNAASAGDEVFQDFSTPFGMQPTAGWHGVGDSGFDPATGLGSNCGVTGFTTHVKDCESGLQYMQARYYDPVLSRFTSVDPVGFTADGRTGMVNRFSYSLNDPVNMFDPNGNSPVLNPASSQYQALQGAIKTTRGDGAWVRYLYEGDARTGRPDSYNFVNNAISAGASIIGDEPATALLAAQIIFDQRLEKSLAYNIGSLVPGSLVGGSIPTRTLGTTLGKVATNATVSLTGASIDSAYQAFSTLEENGIDPSSLSGETMGAIGLAILAEADFSYDSDSNTLTATINRVETGSRLPKYYKYEIKAKEE